MTHPPLVSGPRAAEVLGISETTLRTRINRGQIPVIYTSPNRRWVPARALPSPAGSRRAQCAVHQMPELGFEWTGGDLTRSELAELLGVSYGTISRATARRAIPVDARRQIPGHWIAALCDPLEHAAQQEVTL